MTSRPGATKPADEPSARPTTRALTASVLAGLPDALVVADPAGAIVAFNAAAERVYGLAAADVVGRPVTEALLPLGSTGGWPPSPAAIDPATGPVVVRHRRGDGTAFDAELSLFVVPATDDPVPAPAIAAVVRDVTARQAEVSVLHAVVDAAAEAIIGIDERDVIRFFNPAAERLYGRPAPEVLGTPIWGLVADHPRFQAREIAPLVRAGEVVERETVIRRSDGDRVAIQVTASPIGGAGDAYEGAIVIGLDVSARRRAEREAEHARRLLQRVIDHAPNVVWFKDRDGRCRLVNRPGAAALGRAPEEVLGRTDAELFGPVAAARNGAEDRQVTDTGMPLTFTKDLPAPGGGTRRYLMTKFPISDAHGDVDGVGVVASDISELARGAADSAQLAALVHAAPDAIITIDGDANVATWNPGAERTFGATAHDAIGRPYEAVAVPESEHGAYLRLRTQVFTGETVTMRMGAARADGSAFPAEVSAAPLRAADGMRTGAVLIVRDITQLTEAELALREHAGQLERSNADLEQFAYAAGHDLQEPLRSIKMGAETVLHSAADRLDADERALLAHVDAATARLSAQVGTLMELAQVTLGEGPDPLVSVHTALDDALDALRAALTEADAIVDVRGPLPSVAVPRAELTLVLQNLIANAIKYSRPGTRPRIVVSGSVGDGAAEVRVADNGIGLAPADQARIFAAFGRLHPDVPGMGMGLALCRRVLERRSGSITVASPGLGHGSAFTLRFPAGLGGEGLS